MPLTYQNIVNQGILNELARVFQDQTNAEALLLSVGFPREKIPSFPSHADTLSFWVNVCNEIEQGVLIGGYENLLQTAARMYPGNQIFSKFAADNIGQPPRSNADISLIITGCLNPQRLIDTLRAIAQEQSMRPESVNLGFANTEGILLTLTGWNTDQALLLRKGIETALNSPENQIHTTLTTSQFRDYLVSQLFVEGPDQNRFAINDIRASTTIGDLAQGIISQEYGKTFNNGESKSVVVDIQKENEQPKRLDPDKTLYESGIQDGDTLHVHPESRSGCFVGNTQITMSDGKPKAICAINAGDRVLSYNPVISKYYPGIVTEVYKGISYKRYVLNGIIEVTDSHLFYSNGGWNHTDQLKIGDILTDIDGKNVIINKIDLTEGYASIYNLHLGSADHTFFAQNILVHNMDKKAMMANDFDDKMYTLPLLHKHKQNPKQRRIEKQLEHILDNNSNSEIEVIIQVESQHEERRNIIQGMNESLKQRRMLLNPRDMLSETLFKKSEKSKGSDNIFPIVKRDSNPLSLEQLKAIKEVYLRQLVKNKIVRAGIQRDLKTDDNILDFQPNQFWSSGSMMLILKRDELWRLGKENLNLKSVRANRTLSIPTLRETMPLGLEESEVLISSWGLKQINALAVWGAHGSKGKDIVIGLLDTGVDSLHPDLEGKVVKWAEFDSRGRLVPDSTPYDSGSHGTHCAGIVTGSNKSGRYIGVAPEAKIAAALVINDKIGGTDAQVLAGIDWAIENGVDVISLSLGGLTMDSETPPTYSEAILTCIERGIPVIAAIGNEGEQTTSSPGNDLFTIGVGATDHKDRVAGFSGGRTQIIRESDYFDGNQLPLPYSKPDLVAPGVAIFSSVPGNQWKAFSGTSMAAPHVAGTIALLLSATSIRQKEHGAIRYGVIQNLILGSVEDMGESGQDHRYGFGRVDAFRAIDFALKSGYQK